VCVLTCLPALNSHATVDAQLASRKPASPSGLAALLCQDMRSLAVTASVHVLEVFVWYLFPRQLVRCGTLWTEFECFQHPAQLNASSKVNHLSLYYSRATTSGVRPRLWGLFWDAWWLCIFVLPVLLARLCHCCAVSTVLQVFPVRLSYHVI
jgi:hypothetical protein